jgi:hypothetical protein
MGRAYSTNGEKRNAYRILVGKPEGKILLEIPKLRCMGNIKLYLRNSLSWYKLNLSGSE